MHIFICIKLLAWMKYSMFPSSLPLLMYLRQNKCFLTVSISNIVTDPVKKLKQQISPVTFSKGCGKFII